MNLSQVLRSDYDALVKENAELKRKLADALAKENECDCVTEEYLASLEKEEETQDITPYGVDANFNLNDAKLREKAIRMMVVIVLNYQYHWYALSAQHCMKVLFSHSNWSKTFDAIKSPQQTNEEFVEEILLSTKYFKKETGLEWNEKVEQFDLTDVGLKFAEEKFNDSSTKRYWTLDEVENAVEFTAQA